MWKNEVSSTDFRHIPKITKDNPCKKEGATRKKVMKSRIPWWPELLEKKKEHIGDTKGTKEDQHDETYDDENDEARTHRNQRINADVNIRFKGLDVR